jgi:peptidoglycan hydrolase-like protein with peptidoglycan-binding domain
MFLASKVTWAGIVFILLTTGVSGPRSTPLASRATLRKAGPAVGHRNDVKEMQETLRNKGHYRGKVDGVFGLRTQASIRAYQKAENLPITGQVDTRTADGLGVRPESNWGDSKRDLGHVSDGAGGVIKRDKPSAGIRRTRGRASKTLRSEVSRVTAIEDNRGDSSNKQQPENKKYGQ